MLLLQCSSTSTEQDCMLNGAISVGLWPGLCRVNHPAPPLSLSAPQYSARAVQGSLTIPALVAEAHCSMCSSPAPCWVCPVDLNCEVFGTRTHPDSLLQTAQIGLNADEWCCPPGNTAVTTVQCVHLAPEQRLGCLWPVILDRMHTKAWAATVLDTVPVPTCTFPLHLNANSEMEHHEEKGGRGREGGGDRQKSPCWCLCLANENTRVPNKYRSLWQEGG